MKKTTIIISFMFLLFACKNKEQENDAAVAVKVQENSITVTDEQYNNAGIETGKLSTLDISPVLKLNGKIDVPPQNMISVSAPLGGYLKTTKLMPGMHINKGEVLAVMEDMQYIQLQQDYLTTKAQFALTESEYNRQKELNKSKATSDKVFEQAKANYHLQLVYVKSLEEKLKLIGLNPSNVNTQNISKSIRIYSPITGFVSAVNVNVGKYVSPSEVLFELVNPADIHLVLTVFEKDINKLAIGQKLSSYTNANPQKKYALKIMLINRNVTNQNSAEVHCLFEQVDKSLLPGMFMNAEIELTSNTVMALPEDSFVRFENKHFVFVARSDKQYEMKEVEIGNSENGFSEIRNPEKMSNETFVTKGAYSLLMALKNESDE